MLKVIGVSFRHQCKVYTFSSRDLNIKRGQAVIVETAQGTELATVVVPTYEVDETTLPAPVKPIDRIANTIDIDRQKENAQKEKEAVRICKEKIGAHHLEMKLIRAEYSFDRAKLTFFFTADGRVDFRELVRDLAGTFKTRIELRQVGVRDETRLLGGLGTCGREFCCATWLTDFQPVSIKMAKEQGLSLNSTKISGACGRLMCCLKNEEDAYEELNSHLPDMNSKVTLPDKRVGVVKGLSALAQKVTVNVENDKEEIEQLVFDATELTFKPSKKHNPELTPEEQKEEEELAK